MLERIGKETSPARTHLAQLLRYAHQERNGQHRLLLQLLDQNVEICQAVLVENYGHIHERWQQIIWQIRRMLALSARNENSHV